MIQCKPHGFPADIWSFSVCCIEMIDQKPPNRRARIRVKKKKFFFLGGDLFLGYVCDGYGGVESLCELSVEIFSLV